MSKDILSKFHRKVSKKKKTAYWKMAFKTRKKLEKNWCHHHIEKSRNVNDIMIIECISSINLKLRLVT